MIAYLKYQRPSLIPTNQCCWFLDELKLRLLFCKWQRIYIFTASQNKMVLVGSGDFLNRTYWNKLCPFLTSVVFLFWSNIDCDWEKYCKVGLETQTSMKNQNRWPIRRNVMTSLPHDKNKTKMRKDYFLRENSHYFSVL